MQRGGPTCCHAHLDKSHVVSPEKLYVASDHMEVKWDTWQTVKKGYTAEDLEHRITLAVESFIRQGCKYVRSFIDVDRTVELKCLHAARRVREQYKDRITIHLVSQVLEGLKDEESRYWIEQAAPLVDIIGGLPSRDRPHQAEHLDWVFGIAKAHGKPVDVHIDQNNDPDEKDTELLARKIIEHGMQGKVNAVHACSLASQHDIYLDRVVDLLREADCTVIVCPRAMLDGVQLRHKFAPVHNSIAPVEQLVKGGVNCCIGVDNIYDFFCPFADGNIFTELQFLLEATRIYDMDALADICSVNGLKLKKQVEDCQAEQAAKTEKK
eukprot:NODE_2006_length_1227_cov_11.089134_g1665_i0.p1 GENE.NODE_2006_length_1227_cov_11.089134_g1665_i0~~NODE_2006_length_1227_cov_11.089134_g1665_i0.p1  ORF type:complete len:370 (-),score=95.54 NODE_2006_length_1227_cov_11.089134_g1665_i0:116-1087(-)